MEFAVVTLPFLFVIILVLGFFAIFGGVCVVALKLLTNSGKSGGARASADEAKMFQELQIVSVRLERRMEALETIILDRHTENTERFAIKD